MDAPSFPALTEAQTKTVRADPTLVPVDANFQTFEPVIRDSLERITNLYTKSVNAFDTLLESKPDTAAKHMLNAIRAQKLMLEAVDKYNGMAAEARRLVSTEKAAPEVAQVAPTMDALLTDDVQQAIIHIIARKPTNQHDVTTTIDI